MEKPIRLPILPSTWLDTACISKRPINRVVSLIWSDARSLFQIAWRMVFPRRWAVTCLLVVGTCLVCSLMTVDLPILASIRFESATPEGERIKTIARVMSYWGDFAGFNLFVFASLTCFAFIRRSPFFRRMTVAAVLGTVLTGGIANGIRVTAGRARPGSKLEPGFYGPTLSARKQSFPSAHTATSFGASVPVAVAFPPAGIPMLLVSGGVAWSRMQNNCHHPSDVLASLMLSMLFGIPLGLAVRRIGREQRPNA